MRVGILAPEFVPVWGGVGSHILDLVSHLPDDVEVCVITVRRRIPGTSEYMDKKEIINEVGRDIDLVELATAKETFLYNAKFQFNCFREVPSIIKEKKIDILHSHFPHMSDLLLKYTKFNHPSITTVHTTIGGQVEATRSSGLNFSELEHSERMTLILSPFLKIVERSYIKRTKNFIAVSKWIGNILKLHYRVDGEIYVVPNGVDPNVFAPRNTQKSSDLPVVLFTGRLISAKGIQYLIDAMEKVISEVKTRFVFVGGGDPTPYIKRIERKGISRKYYDFLGYIKERSQLISVYNMADVYVAPTLYENLPIRILEAMACEKPVIATSVCAIPEVIKHGDNGWLIPPADTKSLEDALITLLKDEDLRRKLGKRARKTVVENFNWKKIARDTVNVYERVLKNF